MTITTLPRDHTPAERCVSRRDHALNGVFTTALEGGIGYWSECSRYHWHVTGTDAIEARDFIAVITEVGDGDGTDEYVIDRGVIARGLRAAHKRGGWNDYQARALRDLQYGKYDDADYDSITADLIVQFGLFGEQRYN
jgi:hypothetical protein